MRIRALLVTLCAGACLSACSCTPSVEDSYGDADYVFLGRLRGRTWWIWGDAEFSVAKVWKRPADERIVPGERLNVEWRRGGGDCNGFWPEDLLVGRDLVVFAKRGADGQLRTSICYPTRLASKAVEVITRLREIELRLRR